MLRFALVLSLAACASSPAHPAAPVPATAVPRAVLDAAQTRWNAYAAEHAAELAAALDEAGAKSAGRPLGPETDGSTEQVFSTWDPDAHSGTVTIVRVASRTSSMTVMQEMGSCGKYRGRGGAPASCPPPQHMPVVHSRVYSVEMKLALTYSDDAKLLAEHPYPLHLTPAEGPF